MKLSVQDFNQRYQNTFVRWKCDDGLAVAKVVNVVADGDDFSGLMELTTNKGSVILKYPDCLNTITFTQPNSGYFNFNGYGLYLFKFPERQWKRSLCKSNSEIYNPLARLLGTGVYFCNWSWASIVNMFEKNFVPDVAKAIDMMQQIEINSVALSSNVLISKSPSVDFNYVLWYGINPVGYLNKNNRFQVEDATFEQEIHDEFSKQGLNLTWLT